jgi:hypothetical protein
MGHNILYETWPKFQCVSDIWNIMCAYDEWTCFEMHACRWSFLYLVREVFSLKFELTIKGIIARWGACSISFWSFFHFLLWILLFKWEYFCICAYLYLFVCVCLFSISGEILANICMDIPKRPKWNNYSLCLWPTFCSLLNRTMDKGK